MKKGSSRRILCLMIALALIFTGMFSTSGVVYASSEDNIYAVIADAYTRQTYTSGSDTTQYATMNFGSGPLLEVVDIPNASGGGDRVAYMKVDYSTFNKASAVSARLYFYVNNVVNPSVNLQVMGLSSDAWNESTITWNNPPSNSGAATIGSVRVSAVGWYSIDVTSYVNAQMSDKVASFKIYDPTTAQSLVNISSRESGDHAPYLLIDPSTNADLSGLTLTSGILSPTFNPGTITYSVTVPNSVYGISVIPTTAARNAVVKVNGLPVVSGSPSGEVNLNLGKNIVTVGVTAQAGNTKTYSVEITREEEASTIAYLSGLAISSGTLMPAFDPGISEYETSVISSVYSITVTPTVAESHAAVTVNGALAVSGVESGDINLTAGSNTIDIVVTAQAGNTKKYTLIVNRQAEPSSNADLSGLTLSSGILDSAFDPGTGAYTANLANSVSSVCVKPIVADTYATVTVNEIPVTSGSFSPAVSLNVGSNIIRIKVTAQDGTVKEYTVTVTRAASNNADLAGLVVKQGTTDVGLKPTFASGTANYDAIVTVVGLTGTSITITPTVADPNARVKVNDVPVDSGKASNPIKLDVGNNSIRVDVVAQDGSSKTYTINILGTGISLTSHSDGDEVPVGIVRISGTYINTYAVKMTVNASSIYDCNLIPNGDESGTWYYDLDTRNFDGPVELFVRGYDSVTRYGVSAPMVKIMVDNAPVAVPAVAITNPVEGSSVSGVVPVKVSASSKNPVADVQIRINGGTWTSVVSNGKEYIYDWDTAGIGDKTCSIEAKAVDSLGHLSKIKTVYAKVGAGTKETVTLYNQDRSMWIWETSSYSLLFNPGSRNALEALCKDTETFGSDPITTLYLGIERYRGMDVLLDDPDKVRDFISWAHDKGFKVQALIESDMGVAPMGAYERYHFNAERSIEKIINYNISSDTNERFDGVNVDIEPYTLPDFNAGSPALQIQYLDMLNKMVQRRNAAGINLPFGPAVAKFFDTSASCLNIPWNGVTKPLSEHVQDICDYIAIMDYRDSAGVLGASGPGIIPQALGEMAYAEKIGKEKSIIIGVETLDIANSGDPETITFREEGRTYMEAELDKVYDAFKNSPAFGGIAMHHYDSIRWLPSTWDPAGIRWTLPGEDINPPSKVSEGPTAAAIDYQRIDLRYGRAFDDNDIDEYRIYRYTTPGFVPDASNLAGRTRSLNFSDIGLLPNTTYYYKVVAVDLHGNTGTISDEVSATTRSTTLKPMIIDQMNVTYTDQKEKTSARVTLRLVDKETKAPIAGAGVHGRFTNAAGNYKDLVTAGDGTVTTVSESVYNGWQTGFELRRILANGYYWAQAYDTPHIAYIFSTNSNLSGLTLDNGTLSSVFTGEVTNYNVSVANSVYSTRVTPTAADGKSVITVNGVPVASGAASDDIALQVGKNIITIVVTAQEGTSRRYVVTITRSKAEIETPSKPVPTPDTTPVPTPGTIQVPGVIRVKPIVEGSGKNAKAALGLEELQKALEQVPADAKGVKILLVEMPGVQGATSYTQELPSMSLYEKALTERIKIVTELGTIIVPGNMFKNAEIGSAANIGITIGRADRSNLDEAARLAVGGRPVIELHAAADGKPVSWNNANAVVTVSVPYSPTSDELKNPQHIVVLYIDESGKAVPVSSGRYDAASESVVFTTTHFSQYAIAYVNKTFSDIEAYPWAQREIEVLASKGIINGISDSEYLPAADITRADFMLLLVRTFGLTAEFDSNFDDVQTSDYYNSALGIAKKLGIAHGTDSNRFNPDDKISRQDMMLLIERVLRTANKMDAAGSEAELKRFEDRSEISSYAANSVAALVKEGVVIGNGSKINPQENASRAEAAVLIYRIFYLLL